MSEVNKLHISAMDLAEIGLAAAKKRDYGTAIMWFADAYSTEERAIYELPGHPQPSYSVMCRSAATLAVRCGRFVDAVSWCAKGAAADGCPPEIRDEIAQVKAVAQTALDLLEESRQDGQDTD